MVAPLPLPFSDDFNRSSLGAWAVVDDSPTASNWRIVNAELHQLNRVESVNSFDGSYHKGTYVYLTSGLGWTDYRFSVQATFLAPDYADDIGILFRYQNNDNYYRLSLNSRYGFTRLEKKVNGRFTTLAVNARGYLKGAVNTITVDLKGSSIQVVLNGDRLFAASDAGVASGTIGLYCQDASKFDNVSVGAVVPNPSITLSRPASFSVDPGDELVVEAVAAHVPQDGAVEFLLDGSASVLDVTAPFSARYTNLAQGEHTVEAVLRNAVSELARDTNTKVGVLGHYYVGIGDSITNGEGDNDSRDNLLPDGRVLSFQGYEAPLTRALTDISGYPNLVFNEGIGGDESYEAAYVRVNSILERHPRANRALVLLGTNDSGGTLPVPSGLGCSGSSCSGTYKQSMQYLLNALNARQVMPFVARIPPTWGTTAPSRNLMIQQYNQVIDYELTGAAPGPDFYGFFLSHGDLFADNLHPNALGHKAMAHLWMNCLLNRNDPLFLLRNVSPAACRQNVLEVGNRYYVDRDYVLSSIPSELSGNDVVWIMTPSSEAENATESWLSFDLPSNATVYVAYDSRALSVPNWLSSRFTQLGSSIGVTEPGVGTLRLYQYPASPSGGKVILGGNKAAGAVFPQGVQAANYLVIVKERLN